MVKLRSASPWLSWCLGCCCLLALCCGNALAEDSYPPITQIVFLGNKVTEPKVMLREMLVRVGDPADPARIDRSRQGIQDLGLFRRVTVEQEPYKDGVRVTFKVVEKFYILPVPRAEIRPDGSNSYGIQVEWQNVRGRNERLNFLWENSDDKQREFGRENSFGLSYDMPFVADSAYHLTVGGGYLQRPVDRDGAEYGEHITTSEVIASRSLQDNGPASQGWSAGGGVLWSNQGTTGAEARPAYGMATAAVATASFRDLRFNVYSERGQSFDFRVESATRGLASDYDYLQYDTAYRRYFPLGHVPNQTLHLLAELGARHGGPEDETVYSLGGSTMMRGYDRDFIEGDAFYHLALEAATPLHWQWLRAVGVFEVANAFEEPGDIRFDKVYASAGAGLRIRVLFLVQVEVDIGVAFPLDGSTRAPHFYGGRARSGVSEAERR